MEAERVGITFCQAGKGGVQIHQSATESGPIPHGFHTNGPSTARKHATQMKTTNARTPMNTKKDAQPVGNQRMAEGVGFEPTGPCGPPVFKTGAIDHSTTPPLGCVSRNGYARGTAEFQEKPSERILAACLTRSLTLPGHQSSETKSEFARKAHAVLRDFAFACERVWSRAHSSAL